MRKLLVALAMVVVPVLGWSSAAQIPEELRIAEFGASGSIIQNTSARGYTLGWGVTVPTAATNWVPGAVFIHTDGGTNTCMYVNNGTRGASVFERVQAGSLNVQSGESLTLDDGVALNLGTGDDVVVSYDATSDVVTIAPKGAFVTSEGVPERYQLKWTAGEDGTPGVKGDVVVGSYGPSGSASVAVDVNAAAITDPAFALTGTNAASAGSTIYTEGGITLKTAGASVDSTILYPHPRAGASGWNSSTWGTDEQVRYECTISTLSDTADMVIWTGLKLTFTDAHATDANQIFARYESDINSSEWQIMYSNAGTDTTVDSNVVIADSTRYHIVFEIDSSNEADVYINGTSTGSSLSLTSAAVDLVPFIGVRSRVATAKGIRVHNAAISREMN